MPRYRHRSTSYGSYQDHNMNDNMNDSITRNEEEDLEIAKQIMSTTINLQDNNGKAFLHTQFNLSMACAMLERAKDLDVLSSPSFAETTAITWQRQCLLQTEQESGYTPLHAAIINRNLSAILLFLRHAMDTNKRLTQAPCTVLHASSTLKSSSELLYQMATSVDKEGLTPLDLLGRLQRFELEACRKELLSQPKIITSNNTSRPRQSSFDIQQDELDFLNNNMDSLQNEEEKENTDRCSYACEVITFGRPNLCALGVVSSSDKKRSSTHPQRVQEFAQDILGREGSAVAVAAATHHTLVATKKGHLYAFGLGKGGRLGMDEVQQCPLPRRVLGPLNRRKVIGIAAAENHSLCVTKDGAIFAWGSNRFGQLGSAEAKASTPSNPSPNFRCLPRRVEDLRNVSCIAVAAGEKHSVALSKRGEVYIWGDNTAGQLGIPRRTGIQKVQRVEALWNTNPPKPAIAISAAEQSTLVLTKPILGLTSANSVYSWGHGNYVPIRVHFENHNSRQRESPLSSKAQRIINPVAIACAKYHNAAITSDGHVYTWGLHAESLGRANNSVKGRSTSSPQLVTGMLPENGGGIAIALSASDQHTAVITDCGALFTWGTSYGNNILGHEGVRWQPSPKRVPGVHRAVNVALAKEHTVLLVGSSFPRIPNPNGLETLDVLAARQVAKHVDLFNVVPILIMAERTESSYLVHYCKEFIHRNLDGVLNVGKKSVLNQYLNDMLADSLHQKGKRYRDDHHHPFITDVLEAGNNEKPSFEREWLSSTEEWIQGCKELSESPNTQKLILADSLKPKQIQGRRMRRASSITSEHADSESTENKGLPKIKEGKLDACIQKTANMDLSTKTLAQENSVWIGKEIRGVRKKLNQIKRLQDSSHVTTLSTEQQAKVDRKPELEAELCVYETALEEVETRIRELVLDEQKKEEAKRLTDIKAKEKAVLEEAPSKDETESEETKELPEVKSFACTICGIKCPDQTSYELHINGRKHRNRVAQAAEDEKKQTAASIMEHQQLEQFKEPVRTPPIVKEMRKKNAWGISSSQPKYTLPPPPHPAVPQVPSTQSPWKSTSSKPSPFVTPTKISPMKSMSAFGSPASVTPKASKRSLGTPMWDSSPGSSRCVPLDVYSSRDVVTPSPSPASFSLADFLAPKPSPKAKSPKTWSSPQSKVSPGTKSFAEIQAEEADFIARQDKTYEKGGGTWFIERRERANSLREIQMTAQKEQEERELIEEQRRIEEQIQKELALQQNQHKKSQARKKQTRKANKKNNNKTQEKSHALNNGNLKVSNPTNKQKPRNNKADKSGASPSKKRQNNKSN